MSLFDCFPLMNAYSVNLDWIMKKIQEIEEYVRNYTAVNNVAYAGVWDITKQYPQWALVTDGETSWLSNKPVPVGIPLENSEYWQKLADLDPRISGIIVQLSNIETRLNSVNTRFTEVDTHFTEVDRQIDVLNNKYPSILDLSGLNNPVLDEHYDGNFSGVILMPASCTISKTITISKPVKIIGPCVCTCAVGDVFNITANDVSFDGLEMEYNGPAQDPDTIKTCVFSAINSSTTNCTVKNCIVSGFPGSAVSTNALFTSVEGCDFNTLKSSLIAAIWVGHDARQCLIENCKIHKCYLDGIHVEGDYVTIRDCTITGNGLRPSTQSKAIGACGIYGGRVESDRPGHLAIINNELSGNSECGIDIGCVFGTFDCNRVNNNALNGLAIASNYITHITNNSFRDNGKYNSSVENHRLSAISATTSFNTAVITGNYIYGHSATIPAVYTDNAKGNNTLFANNVMENCANPVFKTDSSVLVDQNIKV